MKMIWKFPLEFRKYQEIEVPVGARFLSVQNQRNTPTIWAEVSPNKGGAGMELSTERWRIAMYDTGSSFDWENQMYLGTVQLYNGESVVHVYEIPYE